MNAPVYGWQRVKLVCVVAAESLLEIATAAIPLTVVGAILYVGYCRGSR